MRRGFFMEKGNNEFKEYLLFQYRRIIINLYKRHIEIVEDVKMDHRIFLNKIKNRIPEEELNDLDYFNDQKYNLIRKKILDSGNEVIRDFEKAIENLDISLKKNTTEKGKNL